MKKLKFDNDFWSLMSDVIIKRIIQLDENNRNPKLDATQTAALRGEITGLNWVLQMPDRKAADAQTDEEIPPS